MRRDSRGETTHRGRGYAEMASRLTMTRARRHSSYSAMIRGRKPRLGTLMGLFLLAGLAPAGSGAQAPADVTRDTSVEVASFDSAWKRIRATYYDSSMHGIDWDAVRSELRPRVARARMRDTTRAVISDMIARLGDSHFAVLPAGTEGDRPSVAAADVPGDVGLDVRLLDGVLVVTHVDSSGSAARAGVHAGWTLDAVDGERAADRLAALAPLPPGHQRRVASLRAAMRFAHRLEGTPGSTTHVTFRDGRDATRTFDLVRDEPRGTVVRLGALPPLVARLDWRRVASGPDCVGVIRFNVWMTPIAPRFEKALRSLQRCRGIVLDLRGNIGGVAAMIMGVAGYFFDDTVSLGTLRTRDAKLHYAANPRRVASDGSSLATYAGAVAVLLDAQSASTTEIFAAALQQLGRARVFGDTSAGQALPSLLDPLPNGDALLYAIADFIAPGGHRIEGTGVIPDDPLQPTRKALLSGEDPVEEAALHWIEGMSGVPAGHPRFRSRPGVDFP